MMSPWVVRASAAMAALWLLGLTPTARAQPGAPQGPAFDCSKASTRVEKSICNDKALGALDRRLDGVYRAALAKARDDVPQSLRTEQRGWVKRRDECWKATDLRSCIEATYQLRIAELQVRLQLVPGQPSVFFVCNSDPSNEIVAQFFQTDPPAARFERGDRTVIGYLVRPAGETKYEGRNLSFATNGGDATVTWDGEHLTCKPR